ncbi:MAG: helix-turn-helix transcriptional regulator [Dehalococcoidales bacterium]|nr:helix-turn-helix transcriptional regulator [Dehalococcoidales bacterium]
MLNERPPGTTETICPVDQTPCEGQGTDEQCAGCVVKLKALGVPTEFMRRDEYKPIGDVLKLYDKLSGTKYFVVDHRYANQQVRYRLLQWLVTQTMTLEEISAKSNLSVQYLTGICLGKSGVTYSDMAKLAKALFGPNTELLVTMHWIDCGFSISEENPCPEDQECVKLLEQGQRDGTVPDKVWCTA